jgi:RNA polymerase sigma-70 factor (ECF subfamily)
VLDWYKKKKMVIVDEPEEVFGNLESPHGNPLVLNLAKEEGAIVEAALGRLGHTDREVLVLHYVNDLSHAEIAEALGLSEDAVRQRKSRALRSLRAVLSR